VKIRLMSNLSLKMAAGMFAIVVVMSLVPGVVRAEMSDDAKREYNRAVEFSQAGKTDSAIAAYEASIGLCADIANDSMVVQMHINVGALYYEANDLTKAAGHIESALSADSSQAGAYKNLGLVRNKAKDYVKAIAAFERYLTMEPGDATAWSNLAGAYKSTKNTSKAISSYRKALKADPKDYRAAYNLGNLLQKQNKFDDAIDAYKKAIAANSKHVGAYYNLAISVHQVDMESCVPDYEAFIKVAGNKKKWKAQVTQAKDIVKQIKDYLDLQGE
jgi:tetratricopeptide (TPR) repeat protein